MKLIQHILTENPCYTAGRKIKVKGLMLHSIGCPQPDAAVFLKDWNRKDYQNACVHGFIGGNDGTIYQTLPWDHRGWHCGSSGNGTHIGIEMCEPDCIRYTKGSKFICTDEIRARTVVERTYRAAVELFAYLCGLYDLDPLKDGVIISHREGHERGIASDHGDPEHLWIGLHTGYTMDGFRKDVYEAMNGSDLTEKEYHISEKEGFVRGNEPLIKEEEKFQKYMVRIKIPNLNIRTGPGTDFPRTGAYTGIGAFTIVDEAEGKGSSLWGRLKSRAGWIALDHTERI